MKTLLINGSPHANGCTFTALNIVAEELRKNGIDTEIVHIGNKDIRGCIACGKCAELGRCVFNDMVNEVAPKFEQADGLVVGSPVYYAGPNGTLTHLHAFVERGAEKQAVEQVGERSVGTGIIHWRADHKAIGLLKLGCHFVHHVVEHATPQFSAFPAGDAATDVLVPDMDDFGLYAVFL